MAFLILSAGRDPKALQLRNGKLRDAGFNVVSAGDSPDLINKLFNGDFDLVLLCDSLREEERRRATGLIKLYTPSTPVIMISSFEGREYEYADVTVPNEASAIVAAVKMASSLPVRSRARSRAAA